MMRALRNRSLTVLAALVAFIGIGATVAAADTLVMPDRDAKAGVSVVVWGVTTQTSGAYTFDFGDGTVAATGSIGVTADRSYVALPHTYSLPVGVASKKYTATLTVGAESASVVVQVFDSAQLNAENLRSLGINMAIQDGLRWLWMTQGNRTTFDTNPVTYWNGGNGWSAAYTSLVTLAFENHGYKVQKANGTSATDVYGKYLVRRGLNYVLANLATLQLTSTTKTRFDPTTYVSTVYTDNPCQGIGSPAPTSCTGLYYPSDSSYQTSVAMLALAGSGAMSRVNTEVNGPGGYLLNKSYKDILQGMSNALVFGQNDTGNDRGGWCYNFNQFCGGADGSTLGWAILGLLDAESAGVVVPAFAKEELKYQVGWQKPDKTNVLTPLAVNNNGGLDYRADANPASGNSPGIEKGGIPLQGFYITGQTAAYFLGHQPVDAAEALAGIAGTRIETTIKYLSDRWNNYPGETWGCNTAGDYVRGCSYAMFNAFKGLKLTGITTISGSTRAAGPGSIPAKDWYAEFQDYLVAHQQSPNATGGGYFPAQFSCCEGSQPIIQAVAELILSPVALVLPDEQKFSTVGLSPATDSAIEGGSHTVTAKAESSGGTPVAGATVVFTVIDGPNAGVQGSANTGSNGQATFTYTDAGPDGTYGTDHIQASIGSLKSNIVEMIWLPKNRPPVANDDNVVTDEDTPLMGNVITNDNDPDGDTMTVSLVSGTTHGSLALAADGTFVYTPAPNYFGTDSFVYKVNDGKVDGNTATVTITINSVNDLPVCTNAAPSQSVIWPPNHQWVGITINGVTDPVEGTAVTITITGIAQDEPTNGLGDGDTAVDGGGIGTAVAQVRAERAGTPKVPGNGRVYYISFTGTDTDGGSCSGTVQVGVPHDQGQRRVPVADGARYNSVTGASIP